MEELLLNQISELIFPLLDRNKYKIVMENIKSCLINYEIKLITIDTNLESNDDLLLKFISAKRLEGCSEKTLKYYSYEIKRFSDYVRTSFKCLTTEKIRDYLEFMQDKVISKVSLNNIRRILSSMYSWLEEEDYIRKSPMKRIHKIKTDVILKTVYSDEYLVKLRDATTNIRDLAIIDLLSSTGIRVGELVNLNKNDMNFESMECIVFGKGNKERKVYFDSKTKIHIKEYLALRNDESNALFVSLLKPHNRLNITGVELMLKRVGQKAGISDVYPHKFRRTLATKAIDKGMPIEQVQHLLGHVKIDTTLHYAIVDDENVKISHKKYLG